jgi:hypothetical protein
MKNKFVFSFLMFLFFVGLNNFLFAAQNDFYGTWIGSTSDHDGVYELKFTISANILSLELIAIMNDGVSQTIDGKMDIIAWLATTNDDVSTRNSFPNGYNLRLRREDGSIASLQIHISDDKRQIIIFGMIDEAIICKKQ